MIYEINFLVLQSKTSELEKIRKEIKDFIKSFDAEIVEEKKYLKRKLAYEIQHQNYGFFTVLRFQFKNKTNLDELKLKLNQRNNVARYIIVRADELPSLKEQDTEKLEKIHTGKKSIKSEDLEKALVEQKKSRKETETVEKKSTKEKTETAKKEEKPKNTKKSTKKTEEKESAETKTTKEKITSPTANKKTTEEKDEDVSLDELDKKLDEILNS